MQSDAQTRGGQGARRGGAARQVRGGRGGSGALRTSASHGAARAQPYERPAATTSDAGKWSHDLFGQNSDLYSPSINLSNLRKRVPGWDQPTTSASLRPYGDATPAAQPLVVSAMGQVIGYASAGAQSGTSAANGAIGIKGTNAAAQARREAELLRKRHEKERAEALRKRKELEAERERKVKIAKEEDLGFVVEVGGLVTGTSAEDVQTAFGQYGEIRFCFVVDESASDLVARLTFTRHDDAAAACAKLDGAIADGRPLRVQLAKRTPMPAPLPPMPEPADSPAPAPTRVAAAPAPPSKMYADQIEAARMQALVAPRTNAMDVDMAQIPTGPRASRGAAGAVPPSAPRANILAQRLGIPSGPPAAQADRKPPVGTPTQPAAMRAGRGGHVAANGAGRAKVGASPLLARLSRTGGRQGESGESDGTGAGRGAGAGAKAEGQKPVQRQRRGSSLLARLS
ncbi:hypothetical protein JCM8202_005614 [Rhodotorula sphaerocarpa]